MPFGRVYNLAQAIALLSLVTACGSPSGEHSSVLLTEAPNFRDVAGYETADGRRVKEGVLYRSDDLADLEFRDIRTLEGLGIKQIYDLRHESERFENPDRLPSDHEISVVEVPVFYRPLDRRESRRKILSADVEEGHFHELLIEANRAFALEFTDQWSEVIEGLTAPDVLPTVIHCADGKDRTGFVVAVILRAIGVPMDTIMEDYLISNERLEDRIEFLSYLGSMGSFFRIPQSEIRPLLEVRREYLLAAFAAIEEEYGSFDVYLTEGLNLDDETLARLHLALLE